MSLSNYPPGCRESDIIGMNDHTISYTASWTYHDYFEDYDHNVESIKLIAQDILHPDIKIDPSTIKINTDTFSVDVTYEDDIEMDVKYMEYSDIEDAILEHLNHIIHERDFTRNDQDLDISFEVSR